MSYRDQFTPWDKHSVVLKLAHLRRHMLTRVETKCLLLNIEINQIQRISSRENKS